MLAAGQARQKAFAVARNELRRQLDDIQVECGDALWQLDGVLLLRETR